MGFLKLPELPRSNHLAFPLWGVPRHHAEPTTPPLTTKLGPTMSHGYSESDKATFRHRAGSQPGWHLFGRPLPRENMSAREAVIDAGLDFPTELAPVFANIGGSMVMLADTVTIPAVPERCVYDDATGSIVTLPAVPETTRQEPTHRAHVRPDTGKVYGLVSPRFESTEYLDVADFADVIISDEPAYRVETVFSLFDSSTLVLSLSRNEPIDANKGTGRPSDDVMPFLTFSTGHGGTRVFEVLPTSVRVECNNKLRMAQFMDKGLRAIRLRHTRNAQGVGMQEKLKQARTILASANRLEARFAEAIGAMARREVNVQATREFLESVYLDLFGAEPETGTVSPENLVKWHEKRRELLARWTQNLDDRRQANVRGSLWGALNAVTQWCDHERGRSNEVTEASMIRRIESNTFGVSDADKSKAFQRALALV